MKCEELLAALNEYVDGTLSPEFCAGFQEHLKGCNPCEIVIDNIRNTIQLYKAGEPYECRPSCTSSSAGCFARNGGRSFRPRNVSRENRGDVP